MDIYPYNIIVQRKIPESAMKLQSEQLDHLCTLWIIIKIVLLIKILIILNLIIISGTIYVGHRVDLG